MRKMGEYKNSMHAPLTDAQVQELRGQIAPFTPECPLMLPKPMYKFIKKEQRLADVMDRVRAIEPLPNRPKPRRRR